MIVAATPRNKLRTAANAVWLVAYLATITTVVLVVQWARTTTLRDMDTPEARAQWQTWREAPPNQNTDGPVRRRPPATAEPPALLLMRDHFMMVMSGSLLFSSLLFAAIMMAARGVFSRAHDTQREPTDRDKPWRSGTRQH
jgi:hypothetical protein